MMRKLIGNPITRHERGFALVVSLSLMLLIVVVAVGLLQLASISLRTVNQESMIAQARANARVALMLAIGQLQQEMGPDQRISVPAAMLDSNPNTPEADGVANPHYTGVWNAAPPVTVQTMSGLPAPRAQRFRNWLVSGESVHPYDFAAQTSQDGNAMARTMVGPATVMDAKDEVKVPVINGPRSGFAWWTSDNGQKATLRAPQQEKSQTPQDLATVLASSRRFNPQGYHAADPTLPDGTDVLQKLLDLQTAEVPSTDKDLSRKYFHDLTTQSEFLPVDVTTGRLKRCLNLRLAWLQAQSDAARVAEGTFGPPSGGAGRNYTLFSWDQLRSAFSYTQDLNGIAVDSFGRPRVTASKQLGNTGPQDEKEYNPNMNRERWRIGPVPVKVMYVVSCSTDKVTTAAPPNDLALRLNVYPVIVLWNPYNIDLMVPEYLVSAWSPPWKFTIDYTVGGQARSRVIDFPAYSSSFHSSFGPQVPGSSNLSNLVIPAGENRVLYPAAYNPGNPGNNRGNGGSHPELYIWMKQKAYDVASGTPPNYGVPFYNLLGGGTFGRLNTNSDELLGATGDTFKITASLFAPNNNAVYELAGEHSDGHANSALPGFTDQLQTSYWHSFTACADFMMTPNSPQVKSFPSSQSPQWSFGNVASSRNGGQPIMVFSCFRKTLDESLVPNKNWAFSMPSHPFHARVLQGSAGELTTASYESAFTYKMKSVSSWLGVSNEIQQSLGSDNQAFMGTSHTAGGQLRAVAQEIPLVAPVSLAQLQHLPLFDYKPESGSGDAPSGPVNFVDFRPGDFMRGRAVQFAQNNAIGNSYASPGIAANKISDDGWKFQFSEFSNTTPKRMDRSYVANKLLWDAWWCSSLAPQNGRFFTKHGTPRSLRDVADQFLSGQRMLPNEAYQLSTSKTNDEVLKTLWNGSQLRKDAEQKLAEFIRINGGFNVNSTSEKAWEQLFAQMLSRPVVAMNSTGAPPQVLPAASSSSSSFLVSRYTLAVGGPAERDNGAAREDRWWDGSRELSADDIKKLAQATVREVKKRGPFLSMADFVNRSLGSDKALALKGALQAALDDPASGINAPLSGSYVATTPAASGVPQYKFPEAAQGALRQGIPGWVTQADLLQTIGPVLAPRSDTFTIRAMGEARDAMGKVTASVWCEAVVQRNAEYVDPVNTPDTTTANLNPANKAFGRKLKMISFRWVPAAEIY